MHPVSSSTLSTAGENEATVRRFKPASEAAATETIVRFAGKTKAKTAVEGTQTGASVVAQVTTAENAPGTVREIGGRKDGPEPTRYGDWEKNGRCIDF
jgi:hypothetical protein